MKITGNDLINLGYKPAPWFSEALEHLSSFEIATDEDDSYIIEYCNQLIQKYTINKVDVLENPVPYSIYLDANNKDERENLDSVIKAMDKIMVTPTIVNGAIMPDACPVGDNNIPVGGVAVTKNTIHPMMHSSDVCCSVATTELSSDVDMCKILDAAMKVTHFGLGGRKRMQYGLEDDPLYTRILNNYFTKDYIEKAVSHLATQGDGNHFFFVGRSELTGNPHIVTHHGSRGFGASVYKKGLSEAKKHCKNICPDTINPWLDYSDDLGKEYWEALQIVKSWTLLNHEILHRRVLNEIGSSYNEFYWNPHNFVFKDGDLFYHAKGSTPMSSRFNTCSSEYGKNKLIPLNMSQPVLVVKEHPENIFGFAPHGAGRNLSRTAFEKKNKVEDLQKEISHLDVRFYSGKPDLSEFPSAYKDANEVIKQIEKYKLATIVDKIHPYGCIMAGEQEKIWKKQA